MEVRNILAEMKFDGAELIYIVSEFVAFFEKISEEKGCCLFKIIKIMAQPSFTL